MRVTNWPGSALYATVVGALFLGGCVTTKVSSFKDPAAAKYRSVAVAAPNLPLEQRQLAERAMTKAAAEAGVRATAAIDIFPPTRDYTATEMAEALAGAGVEALLVVAVLSQDVEQGYVPPMVIGAGYSSTTGTISGGSGFYNLNATTRYVPPTTVPGYTVNKPVASYAAVLYEPRTERRLWMATVKARGSAFASFDDLAEDAAQRTVRQLRADGVI